MKALFISLFAALFALSTGAALAAPVSKLVPGVIVASDEDKKDEKPTGETEKQSDEDKDKKEDGEKKAD